MSTHSPVSPSTADRFFACPGSVAMIERIGTDPASRYAEEGTQAHALGALCLKTNQQPENFINDFFEIENEETGKVEEVKVSKDMGEAVQVYCDRIRADLATEGMTYKDLLVEEKFSLHIDKDAKGTVDCRFATPSGKLYLYDYKHGAGKFVGAFENKQMMYYAGGAAYESLCTACILTIVQPRCNAEEVCRSFEISASDLLQWVEKDLAMAITRAKMPDAPRTAGDHCVANFCPKCVRAKCPEYIAYVDSGYTEKGTVTLPSVQQLSKEDIKTMLQKAKMLQDRVNEWYKAMYEQGMALAIAGTVPEGFKLTRSLKNRSWVPTAEETLKARFGDAIYETVLKSPASVEKIKDEKLKKKEVKAIVDELTERLEGEYRLESEESGHAAVAVGFAAITEDVL